MPVGHRGSRSYRALLTLVCCAALLGAGLMRKLVTLAALATAADAVPGGS